MRAETGRMKFGNDWTGIFIRGDNAAMYAMALKDILDGNDNPISKMALSGLCDILSSSDERITECQTQELKQFKSCLIEKDE